MSSRERQVSELVVAFLAIVLSLSVLGAHLLIARLIGNRYSGPESKWLLLGLGLLTYGVWWILSIPFGLFIGLNGSNSPFTETYDEAIIYNTFGLRFLDACMYFPELNRLFGGWFCAIFVTYLTPVLFFFLLGLLVNLPRGVSTTRTLPRTPR